MNRHFAVFILLAALLLGFGLVSASLTTHGLIYSRSESGGIDQLLGTISQSRDPLMEINFASIYGGNGQFRILHPVLDIKQWHTRIPQTTCGLRSAQDSTLADQDLPAGLRNEKVSCQQEKFIYDNPAVTSKSRILEKYLSGEWQVTESFLNAQPFVDESGHSFAFLLYPSIDRDLRKGWVEDHLSFFKPSELTEVLDRFQIQSPKFKAIASFSEPELREIIDGSRLVMTKEFLLIRNQSKLGFSPLSYWIFDLRDMQLSLIKTIYDLVPASQDAICLERIGNVCWTYNSKFAISYLYHYSIFILVLIAAGTITSLGYYIRSLRSKNREQERHRFSMQVLSHEFRTPVSSLLLLIEQLNVQQNQFGEREQDLLARASSEVYRLQRIIEMGKSYLQSSGSKSRLKMTRIVSINHWICEFAAELDSRVECEVLREDREVETDEFWLRFVIANLVQNAFAHGLEPVRIRLKQKASSIALTVEDQGVCEFSSLEKMTEPFVKSSRSCGMGLGLNIIKHVVGDWKTKLEFETNPTAFTFSIAEPKRRAK